MPQQLSLIHIYREETERWDIYAKTNNGALNPVCQGLFRIYFYQQGGNEYFLKASRKITRIFDKCVRKNIDTFPHTRHRAIAMSVSSAYPFYLITRKERVNSTPDSHKL